MTQEEKELLLRDLCGRLPYGVIVSYQVGKNTPVNRVLTGKALDELVRGSYVDEWLKCSFKPYLRPMSSMTEEERGKYRKLGGVMSYNPERETWAMCAFTPEAYDWLNKKMFDYRGLIEKGLALEAPEGMYNIKTE